MKRGLSFCMILLCVCVYVSATQRCLRVSVLEAGGRAAGDTALLPPARPARPAYVRRTTSSPGSGCDSSSGSRTAAQTCQPQHFYLRSHTRARTHLHTDTPCSLGPQNRAVTMSFTPPTTPTLLHRARRVALKTTPVGQANTPPSIRASSSPVSPSTRPAASNPSNPPAVNDIYQEEDDKGRVCGCCKVPDGVSLQKALPAALYTARGCHADGRSRKPPINWRDDASRSHLTSGYITAKNTTFFNCGGKIEAGKTFADKNKNGSWILFLFVCLFICLFVSGGLVNDLSCASAESIYVSSNVSI